MTTILKHSKEARHWLKRELGRVWMLVNLEICTKKRSEVLWAVGTL